MLPQPRPPPILEGRTRACKQPSVQGAARCPKEFCEIKLIRGGEAMNQKYNQK